jgi:hypothetical protein
MAGREKRRRVAALDGEERRRRQEEAATLLHRIRGALPLPLVINRLKNF